MTESLFKNGGFVFTGQTVDSITLTEKTDGLVTVFSGLGEDLSDKGKEDQCQ